MTKPNHTGALKLVAVIIAVLMSHSGAFSGSAGLWYAVSSINSEFASNSNNSGSNDFSNGVLEIKCPENISTYTDISECSADLSNIPHVQVLNGTLAKLTWIMEGATEATSLPYGINQIDHYVFNEGVTIIRYSGVDYTGNTSECSFTVVISDNQAPKMSAPKSISVKCDERIPSPHTTLQAFLNAGGKASDNCNLNPNTFKLESEHKSNTGCPFTLTRTYQISDWQGNKTKVIQIISVEEMEIEVASEEIQVLTLKSGMVEFIAVQNGNWNDPATWGGAGTPGLNDNVTIQNGVTVTVNVAAVCNDIIINGTLNGAGNTLQVNGSWNNSGIYGGGSNGVVEFTGTSNATISGATNFEELIISKGSLSSTLTITGNAIVLSSGSLTLMSGLITVPSGGTFAVYPSNALTIPSIAGFDVTGGLLSTGNFTISNRGLIRISSGTVNFGTNSGNSVETLVDGVSQVSGTSVVNIAGRLENSAGGTLAPLGIPSGIRISGGTVTLATVGNGLSNVGSLNVTTNGAFHFTGGTIVLQRESTAGTAIDIGILDGTGNGAKTTIGGTFQFGNAFTPVGSVFNISSNIPMDNITSFPNADLRLINDVTVGQFSLNAGSTIDLNNNSINLAAASTGVYNFPLDNGSGVSIPVTINLTSGTFGANPYIEIESLVTKYLPYNKSITNFLNRSWFVTTNEITNPVYNITATYADADISGTESEIALGSWSGSLPWVKYGNANTSTNTVAANGITSATLVFAGITSDPPTVTISATNSSICTGNSTTLTANAVGDPTLTYSWTSNPAGYTSGSQNITVSPVTTTIYTVVVTDGNGFTATDDIEIIVDPISIGGTIAGSTTVCSGSNSSLLTLSGYTGNIVNWEYSINGGSSWSNIANTNETYTASNLIQTTLYRANIKSGTCPSVPSASVTITVDPVSNGGTVAGSTTVCTGTNSTLLTLSGYSGNILNWEFSTDGGSNWNSISNTNQTYTATNLTQTTRYRAVVQNGVCPSANSAIAIITVTPENTITLSSAEGTNAQEVCYNRAILNITYNTTGATGATITGLPAGVTGSFNPGNKRITISGTATSVGTFNYIVTLTDGCGNITETGTITVNPNNSYTLTSAPGTNVQTICINTSITNITYSTTGAEGATFTNLPSGVSGVWISDVITISGTPTVSGNFNYRVTLTGGCGNYDIPGTISVTAPITATDQITDPIKCFNGTATIKITASGGTPPYTYNFQGKPSNTTGIFTFVTGTEAGTDYNWSVTDALNCAAATGTITVTQPSQLTATVTATNVNCNGGTSTVTLTANGGTGPYSYTLNGISNTTGVFTNVVAGSNIPWSVKDFNNCSTLNEYLTIDQPAPISIISATVTSSVSCFGETGTVTIIGSGGTGQLSYTFNGVTNTSGVFTGVYAGNNLSFSITDENNCSPKFGTINVSQPVVLAATAVATPAACNGSSTGSINLTVTGGIAPYSFAWNNGAGTAEDPVNLAAGTYSVTVTDFNGCTATASATITQPNLLTASVSETTSITCDGGTATIKITAAGGTGTKTYSFQGQPDNTTGIFAGITGAVSPGTSYNWRVSDGNGCSTPGTWNVIQPEQIVPGITTSNSPICLGATLNLTTSNATGGTPPYRYSWTGPNGFTANNTQNPTILNATTAASGTYTLTVTDANNCFETTTTVVTVHPATTMDDPANQPVCHNTLTDAVNFTGATSYTWTNNNTTIGLAASGSDNIPAFIATNTGTTPVTATITVTPTANGCPGVVQTFTITVNPVPVVQITNNTPVLCDDGVSSIVLSSNVAGTTYSWTASRTSGTTTGFSNGNGTSIIQTLTGAGIVQYVITPSANGCTGASSTVTIEVISSDFDLDVNVSGSNPEVVCPGYVFNLDFTGNSDTGIDGVFFQTQWEWVTQFTWTNNNTSIGLGASGGPSPDPGNISFTTQNTGNVDQTATITITPWSYRRTRTKFIFLPDWSDWSAWQLLCSGNAYSTSITVTPFAIACPTDITANVDAGQCYATINQTAPALSCGTGATFTWSAPGATPSFGSNDLTGVQFPKGLTTVTYTASKTGPVVTRTCSFTVTVTDNQLPVINGCLGNISTAMTAGQCGAVVNFTPPTATDNCGGSVSLVRTDGTGLNSGSLFPVGVTTIGYLATDAAGNTSTCSFTITVLPDDQPPVITCVSSPQSVCATAGNPYLKTGVDWDASVTENCAGAVTKTYSLTGVTSGTGTSLNNVEFNVGTTTVTWTATDNNGNSSPCSFDVEVTQAPSITTNPVNQSTCLNGSATFTVVATGTPLPTFQWRKNNVDISGATGSSLTIDPVLASDAGSYDVVVTNSCGSVTSTPVALTTSTLPVITQQPANQTDCFDQSVEFTTAATNGEAPYSFSWEMRKTTADVWVSTGGNSSTLLVSNIGTGNNINGSEYRVTITDACGNSTAVSSIAMLTVNQMDLKTLLSETVCQGGITTFTAATLGSSPVGYVWQLNGSTISNGGAYSGATAQTLTISNAQLAQNGTYSVSAVFNITQPNNNGAGITTCQAEFIPVGELVVEEGPDIVASLSSQSICSGTAITEIVLSNANGTPGTTYSWTRDNTTVLTGIPATGFGNIINGTLTSLDPSNSHTTIFTVTASTINGCISTKEVSVTVEDNEAPTNNFCPGDFTVSTGAGICGAIVNYTAPTFNDNCDGNGLAGTLVSGLASGDEFPPGPTTVTWEYTDAAGNGPVTCSFVVTVNDDVDPTALCQNITVQLDASGNAVITADQIDFGSSDPCGAVTLSVDKTTFNCDNVGINNVILTVEDVNGNTATCSATVTVEDNIEPTAFCKDITVQLDASGNVTIAPADIDNGSSDNCGSVTLSATPTTFNCANVGDNTVVLTVTDENGGIKTCDATVTVEDNIAPTVLCRDFTVQLDGSGNATITVNDIDNGSTDNCAIATRVLSKTDFTCADAGTNNVTLTVTDVNGNQAFCSATVTIEDTEDPVAVCQNITVQLDASGNATITAADIDNGSTDNCGAVTLSIDKTTFDCDNVGINTVILTVKDVTGNTATCTATVTVEDNIEPTALCKDITVQLDASGNVTIAPADIDNGSGDNCGTVTLSAALTTFNCANVGDNTVALTVTDENGGIKTCNATVTVEDNIAPTVICQNITVQLDAFGNATITADDIDNGSADNCAIAARVLSKTDFTCADAGTKNVTLTVTDVNGNSESCSAIVTIEDIENPVAVCQNITVQLDASGNATITAAQIDNGSYDNCGIPSLALDITSFDCTKLGTNTVTLTVTDSNGNSHSCAAIVTVKDDVNPVTITATPTQTSIDCYGGDATVTIAVTGGVGTLTYTFDGVANNSGIFNNIVAGTYNWSVTNSLGCGNASGTFVVQQAGDLSATVALTDVTCSSGSDGTITVTNSSGGSGNYEYSNNGGSSWQSSNIFSGLIPGNYNVQIRDADVPSCLKTLDANVVIFTLTADVSYTDVNCNGAGNGTITVSNPLGGSGSYNYSINGGINWSSGNTFTNLAPGTYNVQIQDANDITCIVELNSAVEITEPAVMTADITLTQISCFGAGNGSITVSNPQGGHGTYEVSLNGSNWFTISAGTPYTFTNLSPGSYSVMIRDAAQISCILNLSTSVINEPSVLSATLTHTNVTCNGFNDGIINVTAPMGGNGTYQVSINGTDWFNVSALVPYAFNNLVPGTYTVQIRDAAQLLCSVTITPDIVITEPPLVNVNDPGPQDFCNVALTTPVNLTGSPVGVVFDITGGTGIGLADQIGVGQIPSFATIPGSATVTITPRANGCTGTPVNVIITVSPIPTANLPVDVIFCNNVLSDPFPLTGTPANVVFDITGGASIGLPNATNVTAIPPFTPITGTATVTITPKVLNCTGASVSFPVTVRPTLTASISGSDAIVCRNAVPPTITFINPMALPVEILYNINGGPDLSINVAASSSFPIFTPTNVAGTFSYNLVGVKYQTKPDCFFRITGSAVVTVLETPLASISGTNTVCQDAASPLLTFTNPINSLVRVTYNVNGLNPATIDVPALSTATFSAPTSAPGTFVYNLVSAEFPDSPSCSNFITGSATITVLPKPTVTIAGDATVCKNATAVNVTITNPQTLPVRITYTVNNGTPVTANIGAGLSTIISVNTSNPGNVTYKVTSVQYIAPSPNCINNVDISATVVVLPPPTASISGNATVCLNDTEPVITFTNPQSIPVTVTYKINGVIQPPVDIAANSTETVSSVTSIANTFVYNLESVVYQGSNSCVNNITGSVTVIVRPVPTVSISGDATVCQYASPSPNVTITNQTNFPVTVTYRRNGINQTPVNIPANLPSPIPVPTATLVNYLYELVSVQYQNAPNCLVSATGNATVNILAAPTVTVSGSATVCPNDPEPVITFTNPQALPIAVTYNINGTIQPVLNIGASGTATISAPTATSGIFNYNVVSVAYQSGAACANTASGVFVTITVKTTAIPVAGNNGPVCVGSPLSLTANTIAGATYNWTGPNGYTSSLQNPTVSANATTAMAGIYSVTSTVDGCISQEGTTTVIVNEVPATPVAGNNGPVCLGGTLSLTATNIAGTTYNWTGPNGFTSDVQNPTVSASATMAMAGSYTVTATVNGCTSPVASTIVTVNQPPVIPNQTVMDCSSNSFIVNPINGVPAGTVVPSGTTYSWSAPTGSGFTGGSAQSNQNLISQTLTLTNPAVGATAVYTVIPSANGCVGNTFTVTVNIDPIPLQTNVMYFLMPTGGYNSEWDLYNEWSQCAAQSDLYSGHNDLDVVVRIGGVWQRPTATTFDNFDDFGWQYSFESNTGPWDNLPPVSPPLFQYFMPPAPSDFTRLGDHYFRFFVTKNGCTTYSDIIVMHMISNFTLIVGETLPVNCSASPTQIQLTGNSVSGTGPTGITACARWSIESLDPVNGNQGTLTYQGLPYANQCLTTANLNNVYYTPPANYTGTVTLKLETNDPDGVSGDCSSIFDFRTITINSVAGAMAGNPQTVCSGSTVQLNGSVFGSATGGIWSAPSGTFSDVNSLSATYTPGITSGTVILTLTPNVPGSCIETSSVEITVNSAPQTSGVDICEGGSGSFTLISPCPSGGEFTAGHNSPDLGVNVDGPGTRAWNNPNNAITDDINRASAALDQSGVTTSDYLRTSDYDFAIPGNAIILGIEVTIRRYESNLGSGSDVRDVEVRLMKAGVPVGDNKANTTTDWPTSETAFPYGGTSDLWGTTWTPAEINAINFGVSLVANSNNNRTAYVDYISIAVTYTVAGTLNWYSSSNGVTPIGTGSPFNPVGVTGSGLPNTNTPGTYTFYAECTTYPGCRTATEFVINPKPIVNNPDNFTSTSCDFTDQAALDAAFNNWITEFSVTGGANPVGSFVGTLTAPTLCTGGTVTAVYNYTDDCENGSVSATFTVTPPAALTINNPGDDVSFSCDYINQAAVQTAFTNWLAGFTPTGGCAPVGTFTGGIPAAPLICGGSVTVIYNVSDLCENGTETATFTISGTASVVLDKPAAKVASSCDFTDQAAVDADFASWLTGFTVVSGGCAGSASFGFPVAPALCTGGTTEVTYLYQDVCATVSVTQYYTINAPGEIVIIKPVDFNEDICDFADQAAVDAAFATWLTGFSATGGCGGGTGSFSTTVAPALCGSGTVDVTYTYTDNCQSKSETASFTLDNTNSLVINKPANVDDQACFYGSQEDLNTFFADWLTGFNIAGGCGASGSYGTPSAPDLCAGGTTTVTYNVTDNCGNPFVETATFTINVQGDLIFVRPEPFTAPPCNYANQNELNLVFQNWLTGFGVSGGCSPVGSYGNPVAPNLCEGGTVTVVYVATDVCLTSSVSQTFTIEPVEPIQVVPLPEYFADACLSQAEMDAEFAAWISTFAYTGGCNVNPPSLEAFTAPPACGGSVVVNYTFYDGCGQTATGSAVFTVEPDEEEPVITCPADFTGVLIDNGSCQATLELIPPTATDNCSAFGAITFTNNAPAQFPVGTTIVIWTATDICGNSSTCSQSITVLDNDEAPVITNCPEDAEDVIIGAGCSMITGEITEPTITDNCPDPELHYDIVYPDGSLVSGIGSVSNMAFPVGISTVTYIAVDDAGNPSLPCIFTVWIKDLVPPEFEVSCPITTITVDASAGICNAFVNIPGPSVSDPCDELVTLSHNSIFSTNTTNADGTYPVGTTTVIWTATDLSGNTTTCEQNIVVRDVTAPVIICPDDVSGFANIDDCIATGVDLGTPTVTDDCSAPVTFTNNAPAEFPVGNTTVTWTATDAAGNTATCTQLVTISDNNQFPNFTFCPPNQEQTTTANNCELIDIVIPNPEYDDNCGVTVLTWTIQDPDGTIRNSNPIGINFVTGETFYVGVSTVTYIAYDAAGNPSEPCTFTVWIKDFVKPEFTAGCPPNVGPVPTDAGVCAAFISVPAPLVSDPCGEGYTLTNNYTGDYNFPIGVTTITWTIVDASGNITTCDQNITVIESQILAVDCPADIVRSVAPGDDFVSGIVVGNPTTHLNCFNAVLTWVMVPPVGYESMYTPAQLSGNDIFVGTGTYYLGVTTVTYTLTDTNGSTATCDFTVTITTAPEIECADDETFNADENCEYPFNPGVPTLIQGIPPIDWTWTITNPDGSTSTGGSRTPDDGLVPLPVVTAAPHEYPFQIGITTIDWTATNFYGTAACTQTITVTDNEPPTFNVPTPFESCVEMLFDVVYTTDLNRYLDHNNVAPNPYPIDNGPVEDFYLFRRGNTGLDLDLTELAYTDNCCNINEGYSIEWTITFDPATPNGHGGTSVSGTNQPSTHVVDIELWGDRVNHLTLNHTITYRITDCNGNISDPVIREIIIKPRPKITKTP